MRVLMFQAENMILNLYAKKLNHTGHELRLADNERLAIEVAQHFEPSVIVCSYHSGLEDGDLQFLRRMRQASPSAVIAVLTGSQRNRVMEAMINGASIVVPGMLSMEQMVSMVESMDSVREDESGAEGLGRAAEFHPSVALAAIPEWATSAG